MKKERITKEGKYKIKYTGRFGDIFHFENAENYYSEKSNPYTFFSLEYAFNEIGKEYEIELVQDGDFLRIKLPEFEMKGENGNKK